MRSDFSLIRLWRKVLSLKFVGNFSGLALVQVSNYILPLLIYPYLIRIIGIENFGKIGFVHSLMWIFNIFIEYAYNIHATRDVTNAYQEKDVLGAIIPRVIIGKLVLAALSFLLLLVLCGQFPFFQENRWVFLSGFTLSLAQVFHPGWFFQGLQKTFWQAYANIAAKILAAVLLVLFIRVETDYWKVYHIMGWCSSFFFFASLIWYSLRFRLPWRLPSLAVIWCDWKEGFPILVANFSTGLGAHLFPLLIGAWGSPLLAGYYLIAEKVYQAGRNIATITYQAAFPQAVLLHQSEGKGWRKFIRQLNIFSLSTFFPGAILIGVLAPTIVALFSGEIAQASIMSLRVLAFVPLVVALSIVPVQRIILLGKERWYAACSFFCLTLSVLAAYYWIPKADLVGLVFSILMAEILLMLLCYAFMARFSGQALTKS